MKAKSMGDKRLQFFREMPPLKLSPAPGEYDPNKSEVYTWMESHKLEIFEYVFEIARTRGGKSNKLVMFENGKWHGSDFHNKGEKTHE